MENRPIGIDLSHNNDAFNWAMIRPEIKFVIVKASQGATYKDPAFNTYWQTLKQHNIIRGAYHFLTFTATAQQQADNFLSRGMDFSKPGCLPPFIDIENQVGSNDAESAKLDKYVAQNTGTCIQLIKDFLSIIETKTGRKPIIYTYNGFWGRTLETPDFSKYGLWVANYNGKEPNPFGGWNTYTFWQTSDSGSAIGNGRADVDQNLFNGTYEQLKQIANL